MKRVVRSEILDGLAADDPLAVVARRDLRVVNRMMGNGRIMLRLLADRLGWLREGRAGALRIAELGSGDGALLLEVARGVNELGVVDVTLVDLRARLEEETAQGFRELNWGARLVNADVFAWLSDQTTPPQDVVICNLFLHHFNEGKLQRLLRLVAAKTRMLVAIDPRRTPVALFFCHCLLLLGCSRVTRHDGLISVRAGFAGKELSTSWGDGTGWALSEWEANGASHAFVAERGPETKAG